MELSMNNMDNPGIINGERITENVYLCPDGKYRWVYEFPMLKNPVLLFTVFRVLGMSAAIIAIFALLVDIIDDGSITPPTDPEELMIGLWVILFFIGVVILSYIILAGMYGWKYMVLFEMDEEKVVHIQMPSQFQKSEALGWLTAMAGIASGRIGTVGTGMLAASRNTSTSDFINVRKVIGSRWMRVIKVNKLLDHNQVYVDPADYDFVYNFIAQRCVNAKVRRG